ncbi:MAG: hypothetical protein HYU97_12250 [Deltaproteobacteria bacterium]|nr:hypothetical protein [Deltaproteobacteria bacterium]
MRTFALSILLLFFIIQGANAVPPQTPESQNSDTSDALDAPNSIEPVKTSSKKDSSGEELKGGVKEIGGGFKRVGQALGKGIKKGFLATGNLLDKARLSIQRSFKSNSSTSKSPLVEETDLSDDHGKTAENLISSTPSPSPDE